MEQLAKVYESRRSALLDKMEEGSLLVLYSGESVPSSMDAGYAFEANHHFFYLTGLRRENMALILSKSAKEPKTVLFIEEAIPSMERWTGKRVTKDEAKAISGVSDVRFIDGVESFISRCVDRELVEIAYYDCFRNAMNDVDSYNMAKAKKFAAAYPTIALKNAHPIIAGMRMCKDEAEVAILREAIALTDKGLRRVLSTLKPGQKEYQAQAEFEYTIRHGGADDCRFMRRRSVRNHRARQRTR